MINFAMYKVYVIQSKEDHRLYVGLTRNLRRRICDHNSGFVFSTKGYKPWRLVYSENADDRKSARERERYLKSGCGKEFLKSFIPR